MQSKPTQGGPTPNRLKKTFEQWLESLTEEERQAIKVVSMDMWDAYRQAVRKRLRHAKIVADRFHVMKQLNHQIDLMRRSMQRKAKKESDEALYQALKGSRWVLLKKMTKRERSVSCGRGRGKLWPQGVGT